MSTPQFHLLFLGEDSAWSTLTEALAAAPRASLRVHRAQSLNELLLVLAGGHWHAVALDVHAWNFQGLHYVDKLRSEYPNLPILALYSSSRPDLPNQAKNVGTSHCLALESLSGDALFTAVAAILADTQSDSHRRKDTPVPVTPNLPDPSSSAARNRAISHALNNLLCVITANADILADHVGASSPGEHSLSEIKKAARSVSELMRHLE
jgi:DNA-binding NarL/FixJ family response regulator